jgi:hypothetical protein
MPKIIVTVSATGQSVIKTEGYAGRSCQEASRFIEQALGKRTGEQLTGEFYQQEPTRQVAQEGA